jgi:hypothetical protein
MSIKCKECKKEFIPKMKTHIFCSQRCGQRFYYRERYRNDSEFKKYMVGHILLNQRKYPLKRFICNSFDGHKARGYIFLFSRKELSELVIKNNECKICGATLIFQNKRGWNLNSPSVDIIDKSKPLTIDNVQIVCLRCNNAKSTMTMEEFIKYCQSIVLKFSPINGDKRQPLNSSFDVILSKDEKHE